MEKKITDIKKIISGTELEKLEACIDTYKEDTRDGVQKEIEKARRKLQKWEEEKERIEKALKKWTWNEEDQSYLSLTAFENQINLMNSFRKQYYNRGNLSDKQIDIAEKIIKQNEEFSRMWRLSRVME